MSPESLILASGSPRRREILSAAGIDFDVEVSDVSEDSNLSNPVELAESLAKAKAVVVAGANPGRYVLAADTVVAFNGELLGKPKTAAEATEMLSALSGNVHQVVTGVCLIDSSGNRHVDSRLTNVKFRKLSNIEMEKYVRSGSPMDKAGAYGIQDAELDPVETYESCYLNVVGLPMCTTSKLFELTGFQVKSQIACDHKTESKGIVELR